MRQQFNSVKAALLATLRRISKLRNNAVDILGLHGLWKRPMRPFARARRSCDRQPMPVIPRRSAPHMGDLAHHSRTMGPHTIRQLFEPRNDAVIACVKLSEHRRAIRGNIR